MFKVPENNIYFFTESRKLHKVNLNFELIWFHGKQWNLETGFKINPHKYDKDKRWHLHKWCFIQIKKYFMCIVHRELQISEDTNMFCLIYSFTHYCERYFVWVWFCFQFIVMYYTCIEFKNMNVVWLKHIQLLNDLNQLGLNLRDLGLSQPSFLWVEKFSSGSREVTIIYSGGGQEDFLTENDLFHVKMQ